MNFKKLTGYLVLPIALLFRLKDDRLGSSKLKDQRLPSLFKYWDTPESPFGLNGLLKYQIKYLLDTDEVLRGNIFLNALQITYDREDEGKWVPRYKIYFMRLKWLAIERYK